MKKFAVATLIATMALAPAQAADKKKGEELPAITKCQASLGSLALTDGDSQGWTQVGLGSPRELLAAVVAESGCFTMYDTSSGMPATFLMSAVAGSKEEVDKTVGAVKGAATEGLVRSGALGGLGGGGFKALGMLGGLGGKKKIMIAGLKVISPMTGATLASGSGEVAKTAISFGNQGGFGWMNSAAGAATSGIGQYAASKDGLQMASAFIKAYNAVVGQEATLAMAPKPAAPAAAAPAAPAMATTAIDTKLYAMPDKKTSVRALRAGTTLTPTGKREGNMIEAKDNFGTSGWVAVEDMK